MLNTFQLFLLVTQFASRYVSMILILPDWRSPKKGSSFSLAKQDLYLPHKATFQLDQEIPARSHTFMKIDPRFPKDRTTLC